MTNRPKTPAILAGCGCMSLLLSMVLFAASYFAGSSGLGGFGSSKPEMAHYANSREGRTGNLESNYVDFSFDYPKNWTLKSDSEGLNFVTVEHSVDSKTWENLNVGYFQTAGSPEGNEALFAPLVAQLQSQFAQQFSGLRKVSEGKTKVGSYEAYEGLFESTLQAGDATVTVYTRAVLLPTPDGKKGVSLLLMGTSFHPDLRAPNDLGTKGELPAVLKSFRFPE